MAATSDPRAAGFNAKTFREAIKFAMAMGLPNAVSERVTFHWDKESTFEVHDHSGRPYLMNSVAKTKIIKEPVTIDAAVEFVASLLRSTQVAPFNKINAPHVIVTVLDEDFELVNTADEIWFSGAPYDILFVGPPVGLFDVTIYNFYATARDENK